MHEGEDQTTSTDKKAADNRRFETIVAILKVSWMPDPRD